tara:strand:+ start:12840 stop:12959 length:120 start_codon:yes stop_codon:yes gene_type:complete
MRPEAVEYFGFVLVLRQCAHSFAFDYAKMKPTIETDVTN